MQIRQVVVLTVAAIPKKHIQDSHTHTSLSENRVHFKWYFITGLNAKKKLNKCYSGKFNNNFAVIQFLSIAGTQSKTKLCLLTLNKK